MKHVAAHSFFTFLAVAVGAAAQAQTISVSPAQLTFGTATEVAPQIRSLTVANPTAVPISVSSKLFTTYGQPAFSVAPATFTVAAGASQTLTVTFAPLHNIAHNSELVLTTDHLGAVSVDLVGQGQYSIPYYSATQNLKEEALMISLKTITTAGYNSLSYNTARDRMFMVIDNKKVNGQGATVNTLECVYTGRTVTGYTSRSQAQNSNFNTEHTWPQGFFNSAAPMVSDLHHLFPTDNDANGSRGSFPFGIATTPYRNDAINTPSHLGANNKYEPRDAHKGKAARAIIYFVTRYQNYAFFFDSQQSILRQWSRQFPPTLAERTRNTAVLAAQGNRNPFSDYPQLADRITNFIGAPSVQLDSLSLMPSAPVIAFGTVSSPVVYSFVLVNQGTQPVVFSGASVDASTLPAGVTISVPAPGATVAPGEAYPLLITLDPGASTDPIATDLSVFGQFGGGTGPLLIPLTANGGTTATPREIDAAGISLNVYPNPAQDELTVVRHAANPGLTGTAPYEVSLLDGLGRTVRTLPATPDELTTLDLRGLPAGLYVVRAGGLSRRVVVQ